MKPVLAFLLLLPAVAVGCSANGLPAQGIVRFSDGEPVTSGSIEFRSLDDGTRYASRLDSQGRFHLEDQRGARSIPAGEYEIVVVQIVMTEDLALEDHQHGRTVPRRYADYSTSDLRATIDEETASPIEVILLEAI